MKGRKSMKSSLSIRLILLIGAVLLANAPMKRAGAAVSQKEPASAYLNATEKYLNFNSKKTSTFDFDIKKEAQQQGYGYTWYVREDKGNKAAIALNTKTGAVTAKKAGTAYIGCKITRADGTVVSPEAKVIVRNNITKVDISNLPKNRTIPAGAPMDFNRTILDTDAGRGVASDGITRWEIDNDTAGVGKAADSGVVYPVKAGAFHIRAISFQSKEKYKLWLKNKEANEKYITAASKWYQVTVEDSEGKAVVSDQKQLDKVLDAQNIRDITISTKKDISLTIREGDYRDKSLIVDAPKAEIENFAVFKYVTIAAIKENTWSENAQGNSFHVTSIKIRIIVNGQAEVREIVLDREDTEIEIEIGGTVQRITILQSARLSLSGDGEQIPVTIERSGSGSRITTSIPLEIKAEEAAEVIVQPGAEGTSIDKSSKNIQVKIENRSTKPVIVATEGEGEEIIEAGRTGSSDGTAQPTPTPPPSQGGGYVPPAPTLNSIAIKISASKTVYKVGETLDITGLILEGTYSSGEKKAVSFNTGNISGFDTSAAAENQILTINIGGKTVTYTISVIKADGLPITGVAGNDAANTISGITSLMEYSTDGTSWSLYEEEAPVLPDLSGTVKLYVRNKETATHTAGPASEFQFNLGIIQSISVKEPADKLVYTVGEELDLTGLVIEGSYSDGGVREEVVTEVNVTGFDSSNVSEGQTLTVTISGKTTDFTISIEPLPIASINITGYPWVYDTLSAVLEPEAATADFQWLISTTADGEYEEIPDAAEASYVLTLSDAAKYIKLSATGSGNYSGFVTSPATDMIQAYVESIELDMDELILYEDGEGATLTAAVFPVEATDKSIRWESSDESIVTVNNGIVTPVSEGEAAIMATAIAGAGSDVCYVTVKDTTPEDVFSGFMKHQQMEKGTAQTALLIEVQNMAQEAVSNLSASDFTVDIIQGSDIYESIGMDDDSWFSDFTYIAGSQYGVLFQGNKNNALYTFKNLRVKGIMIHEEPYEIYTPEGVAPELLHAFVSEDGWSVILEFDKELQTPEAAAIDDFIMTGNYHVYEPDSIVLDGDDHKKLEISLKGQAVIKDDSISLTYDLYGSEIRIVSEDYGFLDEFSNFSVDNQSAVMIDTSVDQLSLFEGPENDGSLEAGIIFISLTNSMFYEDEFTKDLITAVGLPEGFDYSASLISVETIQINITGKATHHAAIDSIDNLHFVIAMESVLGATEDITTDSIAIEFITPALTGAVTITGINKFGETLTADISGLVHVGTPAFQWLWGEEPIEEATGQTYHLTKEDIGETLTVMVTADGLTGTGSLTSDPTPVIIKADGPNLAGVTASDATNTLVGMNSLMEYSTDGTAWTTYDEEEPHLPDLTEDAELQVRFAETATHNAGNATAFAFTKGVLVGIEIINPAEITVFTVGEALDISGLVIQGNYSDGGVMEEEVAISDITGFDSSNVTESQTLTITIGGFTASYAIKIQAIPLISISEILGTVRDGEVLTAGTVTPEGAAVEYLWLVSDASDGTFIPIAGETTNQYTLTPAGVGKFIQVSATGTGNYSGTVYSTASMEVLPVEVTGVTLDHDNLTLTKNWDTGTLSAIVTPSNATNQSVIWSSSDNKVASVEDGMVTPIDVGTATITVRTADGDYEAACEIIVEPDTIPDADISGFTAAETDLTLASEIIHLSITVKNRDNEGITGLTADDFCMRIAGHKEIMDITEYISNTEWFQAFTDYGDGTYTVEFIGEGNGYAYTFFDLKVMDYIVGEGIDGMTPNGEPPELISLTVSDNGTRVILAFNKPMIVFPYSFVESQYRITVDGRTRFFSGMALNAENPAIIDFTLAGTPAIWKDAVVTFSCDAGLLMSEDVGLITEPIAEVAVINNSSVTAAIESTVPASLKEDICLNDGSLEDRSRVSVTIVNGIIIEELNGAAITAANLPSGLSYTVTRVSDTEINIEISGFAEDHEAVNAVENLTFTIPKAFILGAAADLITGNISIIFYDAVDKSALTAAITAEVGEDHLLDPLTYVLNEENYTIDSWGQYTLALENAILIEEDPLSLQETVDQGVTELSDAKNGLTFRNQEIFDFYMSEIKILNQENYTEASWIAYSESLAVALAMPHDTNASMGEKIAAIDTALWFLVDKLVIEYVGTTKYQPDLGVPGYSSLNTVTLRVKKRADGTPYDGTVPGAVTLQEVAGKGIANDSRITVDELIWDPNIGADGTVTITYNVTTSAGYEGTSIIELITSDGSASITMYYTFRCEYNYNFGYYTILKSVSYGY